MSGRFLTPMHLEQLADDRARLLSPLVYYSERLKRSVVVPDGFETDFASVPRLPFAYLLAGGKATKAAVIHDYLYHASGVSRSDADAVFREAMEATGQPWWRRSLMWLGVRAFGWTAYQEAT